MLSILRRSRDDINPCSSMHKLVLIKGFHGKKFAKLIAKHSPFFSMYRSPIYSLHIFLLIFCKGWFKLVSSFKFFFQPYFQLYFKNSQQHVILHLTFSERTLNKKPSCLSISWEYTSESMHTFLQILLSRFINLTRLNGKPKWKSQIYYTKTFSFKFAWISLWYFETTEMHRFSFCYFNIKKSFNVFWKR